MLFHQWSLVANLEFDTPWSYHPFGRSLVDSFFKYYQSLGDIQTLAMLSCVLAFAFPSPPTPSSSTSYSASTSSSQPSHSSTPHFSHLSNSAPVPLSTSPRSHSSLNASASFRSVSPTPNSKDPTGSSSFFPSFSFSSFRREESKTDEDKDKVRRAYNYIITSTYINICN